MKSFLVSTALFFSASAYAHTIGLTYVTGMVDPQALVGTEGLTKAEVKVIPMNYLQPVLSDPRFQKEITESIARFRANWAQRNKDFKLEEKGWNADQVLATWTKISMDVGNTTSDVKLEIPLDVNSWGQPVLERKITGENNDDVEIIVDKAKDAKTVYSPK